jgi:hypothetical protein
MKFKGTAAKCLAQYAQTLPLEGTRQRSRFYTPIAAFAEVTEETVGKWLRKEEPLIPNGVTLTKVGFFFELIGGEVEELEELKRRSIVNYKLAELIVFRVVTVQDVAELLKYKGNDTNEVVGLICRKQRTSPAREKLLQELNDDSAHEVSHRRSMSSAKLRSCCVDLFGADFFVEEGGSETPTQVAVQPEADSSVVPEEERQSETLPDEQAPSLESVPVSVQAPPEEVPELPAQNNHSLVDSLGHLILGLEALMEELVVRGTAEDRLRLRQITTKKGETNGETMFRVNNMLQALCGEKARTRVLAEVVSPSSH